MEDDLRKRRKVSCVGAPQLVLEDSSVFWQRNIVCHRFDTERPEYEDFRERFLPAASEAGERTEPLVFTGSAFTRYTNLDTG